MYLSNLSSFLFSVPKNERAIKGRLRGDIEAIQIAVTRVIETISKIDLYKSIDALVQRVQDCIHTEKRIYFK